MGFAPPSNSYLLPDALSAPEVTYPLRLNVCDRCWLVQTEDIIDAGSLFAEDYAYFSSTSKTCLDHATRFAVDSVKRFALGRSSFILEVGCNDGYFLRNFLKMGIPCMGVEPASSTAQAARALGIEVLEEFFGTRAVANVSKADLVYAANVYAHVPDINDFTRGIATALKPEGIAVLEFPHLMRLVERIQFDTVYHEHYSYLSLLTARRILSCAGLRIFDVEELSTHGGSLRVYACLYKANHESKTSTNDIIDEERRRGMDSEIYYSSFQSQAEHAKNSALRFLLEIKSQGSSVAAYGAAAKGNTLLNFAGIKPDLLPYVCDAAESKVGKYLPGSHIPIYSPAVLNHKRPDHLIVLPWNIASEIREQLDGIASKGARFWKLIPTVEEI